MNTIEHISSQRSSQQTSDAGQVPDHSHLQSAMSLLMAGSVSGLLLHWLVWDRIGGSLGMFVWTVLSCAAVLLLNRNQNKRWRFELAGWIAVMLSAALLAILRDADQVMILMYLVMLLSLGMMFYQSGGNTLANATLPAVFKTALQLPARIMLSIFHALDTVIKSSWQGGSQISAVLKGLLLATPLLFVFVLLFASADALFSQQLDRFAGFMGELTPASPLISFLLIVVATGLLSCSVLRMPQSALVRSHDQAHQLWPGMRVRLGQTETAIVMGSLALLFVAFVLLQASYLFGGRELIEARSGLTVANYARLGFFELLVVAALTMGVLMALASIQCHQPLFRRLGGVLIACVMIMLLSSVYRLNLYVEHFGLTMARLVALTVMAWLSISLPWFAATVLRGNARGFLAGLIFIGMACCLLFAALNPAARVAEVNINHSRSSGIPLDIDYLQSLGADVVPLILQASEHNCLMLTEKFSRWTSSSASPFTSTDWRDWNMARAVARNASQSRLKTC
jgi:hypothetical protein